MSSKPVKPFEPVRPVNPFEPVRGTVLGSDGRALGSARREGCEQPDCMRAIAEGRPWHATPRVGTLGEYHYATFTEAAAALRAAVPEPRVRRPRWRRRLTWGSRL
jgi:hypothetical protein